MGYPFLARFVEDQHRAVGTIRAKQGADPGTL